LSNLPADYDLKMYNDAGVLIVSSENKGISNEIVSYNNATEGTYYVQVYGYNKANSAHECYSLTANVSGHAYPQALRTESISNVQDKGFTIYPNPIIEDAIIEMDIEQPGIALILMTDLHGKEVFRVEKEVSKGNNTLLISPTNVPDGIFIVSVIRDGQITSKRVSVFKPN
jgi:Secretion system C-terminal sorting domain